MTKPNSPQKSSPRPPTLHLPTLHLPTLHLDVHQAWRQNEQAIIIPIVYDPPESARRIAKPDETIIPILAASIGPLPTLPAAGRQVESAMPPFRGVPTAPQALPIADPIPALFAGRFHPNSVYIMPSGAAFQRAHHLSIAVPLLLLAGIAVVVFAWVAFR